MNNIKTLRIQKGLTQKALASKSGVSRELIARIETSECNPNLATLQKIANGLFCHVSLLFAENKKPPDKSG